MIIVKKIIISSEKVEIMIRKEYLREKVIKYWAFNKEIKGSSQLSTLLLWIIFMWLFYFFGHEN